MHIGFIGTGNMGSTLIHALLKTRSIQPSSIIASNRTASKVEALVSAYPGMRTTLQNREVVEQSDVIFLCIKPLQFPEVLADIQPVATSDKLVISITSACLIEHLELQLQAKIGKVIPSVTQLVYSGVALMMFGQRMTWADRSWMENLFAKISTPITIDETLTRICSDITSCGPAFIAAFLEKFVDTAYEKTNLPKIQATQLLTEMIIGTSKLLSSEAMSLAELRNRVAVPGGVTAQGLQIIDHHMTSVFEQVIDATHQKYDEDLHAAKHLYTKHE